MRSLQLLKLSMGRTIPLHLAGLLTVEIGLPDCTCKGSLGAVGFAVTPASLLKGLESAGQRKVSFTSAS